MPGDRDGVSLSRDCNWGLIVGPSRPYKCHNLVGEGVSKMNLFLPVLFFKPWWKLRWGWGLWAPAPWGAMKGECLPTRVVSLRWNERWMPTRIAPRLDLEPSLCCIVIATVWVIKGVSSMFNWVTKSLNWDSNFWIFFIFNFVLSRLSVLEITQL